MDDVEMADTPQLSPTRAVPPNIFSLRSTQLEEYVSDGNILVRPSKGNTPYKADYATNILMFEMGFNHDLRSYCGSGSAMSVDESPATCPDSGGQPAPRNQRGYGQPAFEQQQQPAQPSQEDTQTIQATQFNAAYQKAYSDAREDAIDEATRLLADEYEKHGEYHGAIGKLVRQLQMTADSFIDYHNDESRKQCQDDLPILGSSRSPPGSDSSIGTVGKRQTS
ncbi:hypothetical protein B0H67DRAFT_641976 [Lasiosphaeris hirsuta]|uniref:Uncharacterized protein n=1 Tax=Lasiosphaeris hirsuta TaxID=260670 RepID=A0AA40B0S3_9PEZI|nr:hypothetical protein B0H67DRAFT_641976 [Lasiosphaeris hirsuta]